jgi:hypothetical protein
MREKSAPKTKEPSTARAPTALVHIARLGESGRAANGQFSNAMVLSQSRSRSCPQHERPQGARGSASRPLAASCRNVNLKALWNAVGGERAPLIRGKRTHEPASRPIHPRCNPRATAMAPLARYGGNIESASTKQRASAMMARVISEGRLFSLKPFDWAVLLVGMTLCGALTSLF